MANLIYATGRPYGAPLAILRGGATKDEEIKDRLRSQGFIWSSDVHGWRTYMYDTEFAACINRITRDRDDIVAKPKSDQEPIEGINNHEP